MTSACFRCPLPDCDERHPRCPLRRAYGQFGYAVRNGELAALSDETRALATEFVAMNRIEGAARRSDRGAA